MKRLNPLGTLLGFIFTILLFAGLGFSLVINRGLAFNPGKVSAKEKDGVSIKGYQSHAEFEKQCSYCHEPLKNNLSMKCTECHTEVSDQVMTGNGVHSRISNVNDCAVCHADHQGRDFDPTSMAYHLFDHSKASFSLNWHQQNYDTMPMPCLACHKNETFSEVDLDSCIDCHQEQDVNFSAAHLQDFGTNCLVCHDGIDRMKSFDHATTSFPLEFGHAQAKCTDCHNVTNISEVSKDCISCHEEPKIHQGVYTESCDACHTAESWSPAILDSKSFSHQINARFSLALHQADYQQQTITCDTCHPTGTNHFDIQICLDCHAQKDSEYLRSHQELFGKDCLICHDGVDRLSNFDHKNFFPLDGMHEQIQCTDCHAEQVFRGTPKECWQCHEEPEIHAGIFGLQCSDCHTANAWSPAQLINHRFSLNHGLKDTGSVLTCDTCHAKNYVEYTCYNCHEHDPEKISRKHSEKGVTEQELPVCIKCHPSGNEAGD